MKKALVVGINFYPNYGALYGCVNDAEEVGARLERHANKKINFDVRYLIGKDKNSSVSRLDLRARVQELFKDDNEIALLYFAGHGFVDATGGFLVTSDCYDGSDGVSLTELMALANESKARNKVLILDSCHSGAAGSQISLGDKAILSAGMTILTASSATQYAVEENGSGVFTNLLVDALDGGAANLLGHVTPGGIYAHIDQSLGSWQQRPIFKTNVSAFTPLREVEPPISLNDLHRMRTLFDAPKERFALDPSFEPQPPAPNHGIVANPVNTEKFAVLQKMSRLNLVKPVDAEHMYFAAMNSTSCELTALGRHYWRLIDQKLI
jgi:Caspase domain